MVYVAYDNNKTIEIMKPRSTLHIRFDAELKEQLSQLAKSENRTLSNLIETVLAAYAAGQP